ncbi:hypothetical protein OG948_51725 (plasmid) [Embleya sp. NBC_00888]|nr:hypothetical protein OG948_51725 [Embleya sp. NBC_00888]
MTETATRHTGARAVVANLGISPDGYVTGPGGDADMSRVVRHPVSDQAT